MPSKTAALGITEVVLRDAHQSLFATRMRIDDMLPIAEKLDQIGYWSMESWGGATFDACIRYLGEDPWDRIREIKKAMPNTPQQMLFRGENILGYRHYADDVVEKFVERAAINGIDVFRVFDAMNDMRNLETALRAVKQVGKHAQGTISYTVSPVHTLDRWVDLGRQLEDAGADSICIKDMAALLRPQPCVDGPAVARQPGHGARRGPRRWGPRPGPGSRRVPWSTAWWRVALMPWPPSATLWSTASSSSSISPTARWP